MERPLPGRSFLNPPNVVDSESSASNPAAEALLAFVERVAMRDPAHMEKLSHEPRFRVQAQRWCFSLPDLHAFLQREDTAFRSVDYKTFRRIVYESPLNLAARRHGAEITIADNRAKVDLSTYALVWRTH